MWHDQGESIGCSEINFEIKAERVKNSYGSIVWDFQRIIHVSATRCPIEMGFESKCSILNEHIVYFKQDGSRTKRLAS